VRLLFSFQRPAFHFYPPFRAEGEDINSSSQGQPFYCSASLFRSTAATVPLKGVHATGAVYTEIPSDCQELFFKQSAPRVWTQGALLE